MFLLPVTLDRKSEESTLFATCTSKKFMWGKDGFVTPVVAFASQKDLGNSIISKLFLIAILNQ